MGVGATFGLTVFILIVVLLLVVGSKSLYMVRQSYAGVVERLGSYQKTASSGLHILIPFVDRMLPYVDLKEQMIDFPPQDVITKDNVSMQIDAVIYYQVTDPVKAMYEMTNLRGGIERLAQTTLRNIIGGLKLDETLTSRNTINSDLRQTLDLATDKWGCRVHRVELKSIEPPRDITQAMEAEVRAEREKRATIHEAEGKKQSAILVAEGNKQSIVINAEAGKAKVLLEAEAEKLKRELEAEGQAKAITVVAEANAISIARIKEAKADQSVLVIKALESVKDLANGKATKIVVPSDIAGLVGTLTSMGEALKGIPAEDNSNEAK